MPRRHGRQPPRLRHGAALRRLRAEPRQESPQHKACASGAAALALVALGTLDLRLRSGLAPGQQQSPSLDIRPPDLQLLGSGLSSRPPLAVGRPRVHDAVTNARPHRFSSAVLVLFLLNSALGHGLCSHLRPIAGHVQQPALGRALLLGAGRGHVPRLHHDQRGLGQCRRRGGCGGECRQDLAHVRGSPVPADVHEHLQCACFAEFLP
mmetsp:Transcript_12210/g.30626  ORF Transcript_12210/g.30626 Transcript_12210/m.30626 type:complete len:208 (+) Transcript_12210:32-655(+)